MKAILISFLMCGLPNAGVDDVQHFHPDACFHFPGCDLDEFIDMKLVECVEEAIIDGGVKAFEGYWCPDDDGGRQ